MRFDQVDLRLFLHVLETGSITAGAEKSNLALASASARIGGMERTLGTSLLERMRRGVTPTAAGQVLADHARLLLRQIEHMRGDLAGYASGLRSTVKVLANTVAASEFLPEPLSIFLASHPSVDIDLSVAQSRRIVDQVAAGAVDLGIAASAAGVDGLEALPFRLDQLVVAMTKGHPFEGRGPVAFSEVLEKQLIGLPSQSALQLHLDDQAARIGRRMNVRIRGNDFSAVCRFVASGVGLAIMPEQAAKRSAEEIATSPLLEPWAKRQLVVCTRNRVALPLPARQLFDMLSN